MSVYIYLSHLCVAAEHVVAGDADVVELDPPVVDAVEAHLGALLVGLDI